MLVGKVRNYARNLGAAGLIAASLSLEADAQKIVYIDQTCQHEPQYKIRVAQPPKNYINEVWAYVNLENGVDINMEAKYTHFSQKLPFGAYLQLSGKSRTWEFPKWGFFGTVKLGGEKEENTLNLFNSDKGNFEAYIMPMLEFYKDHFIDWALYSTLKRQDVFFDFAVKKGKNIYFIGDRYPEVSDYKDWCAYFAAGKDFEKFDMGFSTTLRKNRAIYGAKELGEGYKFGDIYGFVNIKLPEEGNITIRAGKAVQIPGKEGFKTMISFNKTLHEKGSKPLYDIAEVFTPNPRMDNLDEISPRKRARREKIRDRYYARKEKGKGSYHRKGN